MPETTPKLGLQKPLGNETVTRAAHNANLDRIDQNAAAQADLDAHREAAVLDHPDGSVTDAKLGDRTLNDSEVPGSDTARPGKLLSGLGHMVKSITGETSWRTPPALTLKGAQSGIAAAQAAADTAAEDLDQLTDKVNAQLDAAPATAITIPQGVSIVHSDRKSRFKDLRFRGRTLVNLLGRDGNCEDVNRWPVVGVTSGTITADNSNFVYGQAGFKMVVTNGIYAAVSKRFPTFDRQKCYIATGFVKNANVVNIRIRFYNDVDGTDVQSDAVSDTSKFNFVWVKLAANHFSTDRTYIDALAYGVNGQYAFVDGLAVYEITQAEYDALDTMTADEIAAKYPYVDDMKHVNAVYVQNPGRNLYAPAAECKAFGGASWTVIEQYKVTNVKSTTGTYDMFGFITSVVSGQTYSASAEISSVGGVGSGGFIDIIHVLDDGSFEFGASSSGTLNGNQTLTYTIPSGIKQVRVACVVHEDTTGTFVFSDMRFNIGPEALPFEPQQPSHMYLPDVQARSSINGNVADQVYTDVEGKPRIIRWFREVELDGTVNWLSAGGFPGYKWIRTSNNNIMMPVKNSGIVVKYDGKILKKALQGVAPSAEDEQVLLDGDDVNPNSLLLTIPNTDSGWGDGYTPTAVEIKAYFYGWRMYVEGTSGTPYNTSGTKAWVKLYAGQGTPDATWPNSPIIVAGSKVLSVPITLNDMGYTPYRLMYQLARSVDEPVIYEGELVLHDGPNQLEMGTGIVEREEAKPQSSAVYADYYINHNNVFPEGNLSRRVKFILAVYRNNMRDLRWHIKDDSGAFGKQIAYINKSVFKQSAAYSVTYLALDTYLLGIAPASIIGTATPNIKETVDDAVTAISGLRRDVSVLQNVKSDKQQPQWIEPTLLNGWVSYDIAYPSVRYHKDSMGYIHIEGLIKSGVTIVGTPLFYLPTGYRPAKNLTVATVSNAGSGETLGRLRVLPNGEVAIMLGGDTYISLCIPPFLAAD